MCCIMKTALKTKANQNWYSHVKGKFDSKKRIARFFMRQSRFFRNVNKRT